VSSDAVLQAAENDPCRCTGIQKIRNLLNVFANNVFVASNYSRYVVLKLYVSCNSQIVITCLEVVL
jgi:hypothetical protein